MDCEGGEAAAKSCSPLFVYSNTAGALFTPMRAALPAFRTIPGIETWIENLRTGKVDAGASLKASGAGHVKLPCNVQAGVRVACTPTTRNAIFV